MTSKWATYAFAGLIVLHIWNRIGGIYGLVFRYVSAHEQAKADVGRIADYTLNCGANLYLLTVVELRGD